jgi:hypothetical protein
MGKEADSRKLRVPTEVVGRTETTDTPRRPCIAKEKCPQGTGREKVNEKNRETTDIPEETSDAHGVQKWHN